MRFLINFFTIPHGFHFTPLKLVQIQMEGSQLRWEITWLTSLLRCAIASYWSLADAAEVESLLPESATYLSIFRCLLVLLGQAHEDYQQASIL